MRIGCLVECVLLKYLFPRALHMTGNAAMLELVIDNCLALTLALLQPLIELRLYGVDALEWRIGLHVIGRRIQHLQHTSKGV